ncbi:amidohydrolase [Candidatus Woesearchaeota archaeon]|nr:amidohydrolase [Candidatus Woesearchaeota archaeon]
MILRNCRYVITQDGERAILENADIIIKDNAILSLGKNIVAGPEDHDILDCTNCIIMPGLVNTHAHLGMHSLKGICDDKELHDWLSIVVPKEKAMSKRDVLANTLAGAREALLFGTTTIYDSYAFAEDRAAIFQSLGMRALVSSTIRKKEDIPAAEAMVASLCSLKGMAKKSLVTPALAVHSPYECEEDVVLDIVRLSNKHNVLRRIHIGETRKERYDVLNKKGKLPIDYLESLGFLDEKALLVHAIWITKGEVRTIAKHGAKVSHNPTSNMKLASGGVMPLIEMLNAGVCVGLGTDSVVSNNNLDMFGEMKLTGLLHKQHRWDPTVLPAQRILDMATRDAAACLGLPDIGSIEPGKKADLIVIPLAEHLLPVNDLVSNIIYCANGSDIRDVIIDGKIIVKERLIWERKIQERKVL